MPRRNDAPRDLLFGLLALQNGMVNQPQLVAAFGAWTTSPGRTIADLLVEHGALTASRRVLLDALLAEHLAAHGGDAEKSLAALELNRSTRESLTAAGGPDVADTLVYVGSGPDSGSDPDRTSTYSVGSATSDGQRFRVLRPHLRGGLGAVFVAMDSELNREVALKQILDHHADDPDSRQRFLLEAEITGGLEHPGVVPVYGLGTYDGGRPYYAMRFIKGDSLKEATDRFHADTALKDDPGRRSLGLRHLLRRFTDVCNAIEYAHSRGVLHRDIKPGNIIVGKHGETLVVDWGLAKVVGRTGPGTDLDERTLAPSSASGSAETLPGSVMGTPAYMSPEQAGGAVDRLGPRSDVYSLGATLYSLLTGRPPFQGEAGEVLRRVQRGEFVPPRQLDPSIDRALEAVCLTAMATKPEDRYPSCRALADDIERWMADEPVTAWREPPSRRARRWARRHRTAMTAAAAAMVAGVVGLTAVAAVQTRARNDLASANGLLRGALARETAGKTALAAANAELSDSKAAVQARYDLAVKAIKTFHTGVSEDFLLTQDQFKELRDRLLTSAADFYGKLGALLGKETDIAARRALAASNYELADLTWKVGRGEDALAAHRAVLAAREAMAKEPGAGAGTMPDVGRSLTAVAALLESTGQTEDALAAYRRSESLLAGPAGSDASARAALAACRARLGSLLSRTGRADEALAAYTLARSDQEAMAAAPEASIGARRDLADTVGRIGILLQETGRLSEAEAEKRTALAIRTKLVADNPTVTGLRGDLALSHLNLGHLLRQTGKPSGAEAAFRAALALYRKLSDDYPAVTEFRRGRALSHLNLGTLLSGTGKASGAEAEYRAAQEILRRLADDDPTATEFRNRLALSHLNLGALLRQTGKPAEAEAEYGDARALYRKLADDNPTVTEFQSRLALAHNNLGNLLKQTSKPAEAEAAFRAALAIYAKLVDANPAVTDFRRDLAQSHNNLGIVLRQTGRPSGAEAEYRAALALYAKLADDNPAATDFRRGVADSHILLGNLLSQRGEASGAEAEHRAALAILRRLAEDHPAVTEFRRGLGIGHYNLGNLLSQTGKASGAEVEHRAALAILRKLADDNPTVPGYRREAAIMDNGLSGVLRGLGRPAEARDQIERAVATFEALVQAHPRATDYRAGLAETYLNRGLARRGLGDPAGAAADVRRALGRWDALPSRTGQQDYFFACSHAALAGLATRDGSGVSADEASSAAETAMALLHKAVARGFRSPHAYRTEDALDPLRGRADFRLLMMDLAMPSDPFARAD